MTPPKVNSTTVTDTKGNEEEESPDEELESTIIRIINIKCIKNEYIQRGYK
jgi:hypothetical protein